MTRAHAGRGYWHGLAVLLFAIAARATMRAWFDPDRLPAGDFPGAAAEVQYVRDAVVRYGRVPVWDSRRFGGTTHFMSSIKELAALPLAVGLGAVEGTKWMFLLVKILAALGMYWIFARLLRAPKAGLVAGYAYAFGAAANHQTALGGHLDVAVSSALFPLLLLATVELLRRRRWPWAIALGVVAAVEFAAHSYLQAMVLPVIVLLVVAIRPWRRSAVEDDPIADRVLARRWGVLMAGTFGVFLLFAGSQLVWLAADLKHHQLFEPAEVEAGVARYVELSPFMFVNRGNWLGPWLETHHPPGMIFDPADSLFAERRYLGIVALAVCAAGWFAARGRYTLRRWYQLFALLLLLQYWMSMGPQTLVWQLGRTFHWAEGVDDTLRAGLTLAALGCLGWGGWLLRRAGGPRTELAFGLALLATFTSYSLFDACRTALPPLRGMRSPGHFFDLAPFSYFAMFGVGLTALERRMRDGRAAAGLVAALAALVVADFRPSTAAFSRGGSMATLRALGQVAAELPGEDGTLRIGMYPWSYSTLGSLVAARAEAGAAWSWLGWQAGLHWRPYVEMAMVWMAPGLDAARRERARALGDALSRIGRLKYVLEDFAGASRLHLEPPWTLRAEHGTLALWEQPEVMPMASGYRTYAVVEGGSAGAQALASAQALRRGMVVVSGEEVPAGPGRDALTRQAAFVLAAGDPAARAGWARFLAAQEVGPPVSVRYRRPAPEEIALETDAGAGPATVLVAESYHPWWHATVDGRPAALWRAETTFMAVPVGPGAHTIDLRLRRPAVVVAADAVGAGAWVVLALGAPVVGVVALGRRRRTPPAG